MWSAPLFKHGACSMGRQAPQPQAPQHSSSSTTQPAGLRSNQLCVSAWVTRQSAIPGNTKTKSPRAPICQTAILGRGRLLCFFRLSYCVWYDFYQEQRSHWDFDETEALMAGFRAAWW